MPILIKIGAWMLLVLAGGLMLYHCPWGRLHWFEEGHPGEMIFWGVVAYIVAYIFSSTGY